MSNKAFQFFVTKTLYPKALYLVLFTDFSVVTCRQKCQALRYKCVTSCRKKRSNHQLTVLFVIIYALWFFKLFYNFSVLAHEKKYLLFVFIYLFIYLSIYLLEIKESLLIMRNKPSLNRNINSAPLYLFDKVSYEF